MFEDTANPSGAEQSIESRMEEFLDLDDQAPEETEVEDAPETSEPEEQDGEPEEETEEAGETAEPEFSLEIEWNGQVQKLDAEKAKELAQKGFDYTQKTMELAEQRRAFEAQRQAYEQETQVRDQLNNAFADLRAFDQALQQYQQIDWNALRNENPLDFVAKQGDLMRLQQQRGQIAGWIQQAQQQMEQSRQVQIQQLREQGAAVLAKELPGGWTNETKQAILQFGLNQGFTPDEMGTVLDPRYVKVLHKAMMYDQLQAKKPAAVAKVQKAPIKPNSATAKPSQKQQQAKQTRDLLKKTGDPKYAAKLLESML